MAYVNAHKRLQESLSDSEVSQKRIRLPWCSSRKVCERRKPRRVSTNREIRSTYPERGNIWKYEYLYENNNEKLKRTKVKTSKRESLVRYRCNTAIGVVMVISICLGFLVSLWMPNEMLKADLITGVVPRTKFMTLHGLCSATVNEECCNRLKYLTKELSKSENSVRALHRIRYNLMLTSRSIEEMHIDSSLNQIEGATVTKGSKTEEWGGRIALWGVIPLWRASPPPGTILALRKVMPSDCWPFSGSEGEVEIHLAHTQWVDRLSIEHVRPDIARSAPKHFVVYGIQHNDTWTVMLRDEYRSSGAAKQFFNVKKNVQVKRVIFQVNSNHGNPKYTCIYRVHLYSYKRS
ncbi:sperm-associated antigen 4 protein [Bombyx mandarina]|uniref:Sperm-associated antigen 4 protein n=1 Tax=Bombyx mandarina TaxID=7092 RepID=A0A6J2KRA6_BOMMA|nr:sperm-associated antigen 4 protein [Bombyx mandarina]